MESTPEPRPDNANAAIVRQFYQAFDDRQIEFAFALLASPCRVHLAGMPEVVDGEGFKQFGLTFYHAFGDGQHVFDEVMVVGNRVVTWGTFTATHLGPFQGLPPTGKRVQLAVMHIDQVEEGKIVEHWGYGDALGLMQQLGIIFLPGPTLIPPMLKSVAAQLFGKTV